MTLVVDASVALKWVVPEPGWQLAHKVRASDDCVAPELVIAELANVLWKLARRNEIGESRVNEIIVQIPGLFDRLDPLVELLPAAAGISLQLDHPAYDCFYLALAEREGAPLVTADKRLLGRVAGTQWERSVLDLASFTS